MFAQFGIGWYFILFRFEVVRSFLGRSRGVGANFVGSLGVASLLVYLSGMLCACAPLLVTCFLWWHVWLVSWLVLLLLLLFLSSVPSFGCVVSSVARL